MIDMGSIVLRNVKSAILFLFLIITAATIKAQTWPAVTRDCKPATRWWWLGSAVNSTDLKWNIDEFARVGIGTVEITPIYGVKNNESKELSFLSAPWMKALKETEDICTADSVEVDMNCGTGWPFGGPQVAISESACKMLHQSWNVDGGKKIRLNILPFDAKVRNYTYLNKLMAYPVIGKPLDLTNKVNDSLFIGKLPKGSWHLMAIYVSRTLQKVSRAAPGGEGYVIDHFDSTAVRHYLARFDDAFMGSDVAWPNTFFNDSYEVYDADWTPALFNEFLKRRGYKLEEHLPELFGEKDDKGKTLSDYRETLSELLIDNFTTQWTVWAHSHGITTRNQAHGSPANLIDTYSVVDVPEIEGFGLSEFHIKGLREDLGLTRKNYSDLSMLKYASSAAHITGKKITSSETFTWLTEHFRASLSQCKPDLDLMFVSGVNRVFFHGSCYSPKDDAWPGWKFYASIDMSPTNPFWRDVPDFMKYITRCQSFLQMGEPDNDYLVYLPIHDIWRKRIGNDLLMMFEISTIGRQAPEFIKSVLAIDSLGFDCDYISDKYLLSTTSRNGFAVTAAGTSYKAILVPDSAFMTTEVKDHLLQLASQGCVVTYGTQCNAAKPEQMKTQYHLKAVRRRNSTGYHYFISNLTADDVDAFVPLAVQFKSAMLFNPMTGQKYSAIVHEGKVYISLKSGESIILQTFNDDLHLNTLASQMVMSNPKVINKGWQLSFENAEPSVTKVYQLDTLQTWERLDSTTAVTMGTGSYKTTFHMTSAELKSCQDFALDLGDVRESARVWINGQYLGCVWAVPYILQCNHTVKVGSNTIRIDVTNLAANRIADMDRKGIPWRKFKEINFVDLHYEHTTYEKWKPVLSGLHSVIKLYQLKRAK